MGEGCWSSSDGSGGATWSGAETGKSSTSWPRSSPSGAWSWPARSGTPASTCARAGGCSASCAECWTKRPSIRIERKSIFAMNDPFALWITGLPASGKSTLTRALVQELAKRGVDAAVLESDELRRVLTPRPSYDEEERDRFYGS